MWMPVILDAYAMMQSMFQSQSQRQV